MKKSARFRHHPRALDFGGSLRNLRACGKKASYRREYFGYLPTLQYDKPFDRLHRIHQLDISEIKSSGYVVDTLEAAFVGNQSR